MGVKLGYFYVVIKQENLEIKKPTTELWVFWSGERGIRTPGGVTLNSFQDCRIRPLCHFSLAEANIVMILTVTQ
jgi:hypothetical protein